MEQKNHKNIESFKGRVISVKMEPSDIEGVKQDQYTIDICSEEVGEIIEMIPLGLTEHGGEIENNSILSEYIRYIRATLPQTKMMQEHSFVLAELVGKNIHFIKKSIGPTLFNIPPKKYWIPQPE